jgi:hypothetical protein
MPWFKVDDGLHSHPKWLGASLGARALWVTAGSWSASHLTDGHIPRHVLASLGGRPKHATELVELGLWAVDGDGWRFHDWDAFQPSSESVEADRANARERQRRAREKARASRRDSQRDTPEPGERTSADCSETANVSASKSRNGNTGVSTPDEQPSSPVTSMNGFVSRRDSRVIDAVSHGPPDPTRPDLYGKGGGSLQAAATETAPPRRCQQHTNDDNPPPCGACADARRTHDTWQRQQPTAPQPTAPTPPPVHQVLERYRDIPVETDGKGIAAAKAALRGIPTTDQDCQDAP